MWKCPGCGEEVDDQFGVCWKCETSRDLYDFKFWAAHQERIAAHMDKLDKNLIASNEAIALQRSNGERFAALLDRWERLTDSRE